MNALNSVSILMVCPEGDDDTLPSEAQVIRSGSQALQLMRMTEFDLVVAPPRLSDMSIWHFVQSIRALWPWQKWALVGADISAEDEIRARTLGVAGVFDRLPAEFNRTHLGLRLSKITA